MKKILSGLLIIILVVGCSGIKNDIDGYQKWSNEIVDKANELTYTDPNKVKKEEAKYKKNLMEFKTLIEKSEDIEMSDEAKKKHKEVIKFLEEEYSYFKILYKNRSLNNNDVIDKYNKAVDKLNNNASKYSEIINDTLMEMEK